MSGLSQDSVPMTTSGSVLASSVCSSTVLLTTDWQFINTIFLCCWLERALGLLVLGTWLPSGVGTLVDNGVEVASGRPIVLGVLNDLDEVVDGKRLELAGEGVWMDPTSGKLDCLVSSTSTLYMLSSLVASGRLNGLHEKLGWSQVSVGQNQSTLLPS